MLTSAKPVEGLAWDDGRAAFPAALSQRIFNRMRSCMFCERELEKLSEEHVFPAALGGKLVVQESVCTECNNSFSKFEQPLARELAPIRLLLKIPDRYGRTPEVPATAKTKDKEYEARVKSDGSVQFKPIVIVVPGPNGSKEIVYQFATDQQKEKLRREAQEKKIQLLESEQGQGQEAEIHVSGDLKFIGSPEGLRTAAKIGYVALAYITGTVFAAGPAFSTVRAYIKNGGTKPSARLFIHQTFLEAVETGPHQHSVIIAGRHDKHRVDAIVRLFGGLAYFVALSDNYEGADFFNTLVYDACRGETNGMLFSHEQAEFLQTEDVATSAATIWDDLARSGEWFVNFVDASLQAKIAKEVKSAK